MSHAAAVEPNCLNCGAELQGKYRHVCGPKGSAPLFGLPDFVHEAAREFLHLDGKILQTMKLLVAPPGELTRVAAAVMAITFAVPLTPRARTRG